MMEIVTQSHRAAKKDFLDWWQVVWGEIFGIKARTL